MSQELCHFFAGTTVGGALFARTLLYIALAWLAISFFLPIFRKLGNMVADSIVKKSPKKRKRDGERLIK
jgi:predicted membrane channel-forming protein YqfA (hemolysin III family)